MLKSLVLCMALLPATALAWDTPLAAMEGFLAWELAGGRLQTDEENMARHVHLDPDTEGGGADTLAVTDGYRIDTPRCKADRCEVKVHFHLPGMKDAHDLFVANGKKARTEKIPFVVTKRDGQWRVHWESLPGQPYVSPAALAAHRATLAADEEGNEEAGE